MEWKRARTPEQKSERVDAILNAARSLFSKMEYRHISVNGIAKEAGFTRSNVYRYFQTQEDIFLTLYREESLRGAQFLYEKLESSPTTMTNIEIADLMVHCLLRNDDYVRLLLLSSSLEKNASEEVFVELKLELAREVALLYGAMQRFFPTLTRKECDAFFLCVHALISGLWTKVPSHIEEIPEEIAFFFPKPEESMRYAVRVFLDSFERSEG